jgi:hypothetical protein
MTVAVRFEPENVKELEFKGGVNTPEAVLLEQIATNIRRGLPQAMPYQPNQQTAVIVGGGPSLQKPEVLLDLKIAEAIGGKIVALNGAYQWCIDHDIRPSCMVMLDAREFNARFVETEVERCHYMLAAQCHPKAFEACKDRKVTIWHGMSAGQAEADLLEAYYWGRYCPVTLGTTVAMRAISLLRMLGFMKMEVFGVDSCWLDETTHHAYDQPENNKDRKMSVWLRPRDRDDQVQRFICSPWQAKQAEDFLELTRERGESFELNVHGDGLIATMIRTGASLQLDDATAA